MKLKKDSVNIILKINIISFFKEKLKKRLISNQIILNFSKEIDSFHLSKVFYKVLKKNNYLNNDSKYVVIFPISNTVNITKEQIQFILKNNYSKNIIIIRFIDKISIEGTKLLMNSLSLLKKNYIFLTTEYLNNISFFIRKQFYCINYSLLNDDTFFIYYNLCIGKWIKCLEINIKYALLNSIHYKKFFLIRLYYLLNVIENFLKKYIPTQQRNIKKEIMQSMKIIKQKSLYKNIIENLLYIIWENVFLHKILNIKIFYLFIQHFKQITINLYINDILYLENIFLYLYNIILYNIHP